MRKGFVFRQASALAAVMALLAVLALPAWAVDVNYQGALDDETGEPVGSASESVQQTNIVQVSDGVSYDRERRLYLYTAAGNGRVACSVVDGMVVQEPVSIEVDEGLNVNMYKDGEPVTVQDMSHISSVGEYVLEATNNSGLSSRVLTFAIVGEATGRISSYTMPDGFFITDASMEGGEVTWDRNYVDLSADGQYVVDYRCARSGLNYTLEVLIDHTPPTLALEAVENGRARGPVSLEDLEDGAGIAISYNGGNWQGYQKTLTKSGDYKILVQDAAGNLTTYQFTIMIYLDANSLIFMAMVMGVIAAVGVYLWLSRKRLKVR